MSFTEFWNLYPRKVSRKMAEKAWCRLNTIEQQQAIETLPVHIKYWDQLGTAKEYIPHATTWLNQARYEDEIEMPQPKQQPQTTVAWWASESLIIAKGRDVNLMPRPGESIHEFKGRVADKLRAAA